MCMLRDGYTVQWIDSLGFCNHDGIHPCLETESKNQEMANALFWNRNPVDLSVLVDVFIPFSLISRH